MNYQGSIAQGLVDELLAVIHKYDDTMILPTVLGCLDIVKEQLILDHIPDEDDDE
jgi:hypothetical protein